MMGRSLALVIGAGALILAACGQSTSEAPTVPSDSSLTEEAASAPAELPPVDAALLGAPNNDFIAFEPTEAGIEGAASIHEALGPLISVEGVGEGETVHLTVQETADTAIADIVRNNIADNSIAAGHVRVEFRHEPEGWYPTNAYRRSLCRRGAVANQWSAAPCP